MDDVTFAIIVAEAEPETIIVGKNVALLTAPINTSSPAKDGF